MVSNDTNNNPYQEISSVNNHEEERKLPLVSSLNASPMVLPTPVRDSRRRSGTAAGDPTGTVFSTAVNITNSIIGAGMLGLPYALSQTGVILGVVFFALAAGGEWISAHVLNKCVISERKFSYRALAIKTLPFQRKTSKLLAEIIISCNCFGAALSYLIIIGDLMPEVYKFFVDDASGMLAGRQFWITAIGGGICLPLSLLPSLDALKYSSIIGVAGIVYIVVVTVLYGFDVIDPCDNENDKCTGDFLWGPPSDINGILKVLSLYIFAYVCTVNMPSMCYEMKRRSIKKLDLATGYGISGASIIYILCAFCGYRAFGDLTEPDLLKSLPNTLVATIVRICLALNLITTFPLQIFPTRNSVSQIIWDSDASELSTLTYFSLVFILFLSAWGIAMVVSDLGVVLSIVGGTSANLAGFILPCWYYITLYPEIHFMKICAIIVFTISFILMPVVVICIVLDLTGAL